MLVISAFLSVLGFFLAVIGIVLGMVGDEGYEGKHFSIRRTVPRRFCLVLMLVGCLTLFAGILVQVQMNQAKNPLPSSSVSVNGAHQR